jgi:NTE family protein
MPYMRAATYNSRRHDIVIAQAHTVMNDPRKLRFGLVLGSGSARGWAHIGVIRTLVEAGFKPDLICGTSIGSLVAAAYAMGRLDDLEDWVRDLSWQDVVGFLDISFNGGLIKGEKLIDFFRSTFESSEIGELDIPFAAVATDLQSGREIWLQQGSVFDAVRASIALPGLFTPARHDGRYVVDGGLVNPVPVSLARAMGADVVVAVDLNADLIGRHTTASGKAASKPVTEGVTGKMLQRLQQGISSIFPGDDGSASAPSMLDVISASINIMQVRVTRSRLAGDPADVLLTPRVSKLELLDYHRGPEAISAGAHATEDALSVIEELLGNAQ